MGGKADTLERRGKSIKEVGSRAYIFLRKQNTHWGFLTQFLPSQRFPLTAPVERCSSRSTSTQWQPNCRPCQHRDTLAGEVHQSHCQAIGDRHCSYTTASSHVILLNGFFLPDNHFQTILKNQLGTSSFVHCLRQSSVLSKLEFEYFLSPGSGAYWDRQHVDTQATRFFTENCGLRPTPMSNQVVEGQKIQGKHCLKLVFYETLKSCASWVLTSMEGLPCSSMLCCLPGPSCFIYVAVS